MLNPASCACWTTQSIAAMTCETSLDPSLSATLSEITRASGAIPLKLWFVAAA